MEIKVLQESTPGVDFCSCMCLISNPPRWVWLDETKKKKSAETKPFPRAWASILHQLPNEKLTFFVRRLFVALRYQSDTPSTITRSYGFWYEREVGR